MTAPSPRRSSKVRVHDIIFQHDSPAERAFDGTLIAAILLSVLIVVLDSVPAVAARYGNALRIAEWIFTVLFTIEYGLRLWSSPRPLRYARSFYGLVDLLAILPAYLSIFFPAGRFLAAFRILRVIRVFRILKLAAYVEEASVLNQALRASRHKIIVFITTVLTTVVVIGALMYLVESGANPKFSSIPESVYWAIVTLTTVGYGDLYPITPLGKTLASFLMILGYGILAVPTGIVTLELQRASVSVRGTRKCPGCGSQAHDADAGYCKYCGTQL
jgi:voltage-gated potassium channel